MAVSSLTAASAGGSPIQANMRSGGSGRAAGRKRSRLGQPGFIDIDGTHDFPEKPKWMRWRRYRRLRAKDSQFMRAYEDGFCQMAMAFLHRHG
jgi:hypothetical protein